MSLTHYSKFSMITLRIWVFKSSVLIFLYSFSVSMVRRRISEAQRWQIIDMHTTGMSFKAIGLPLYCSQPTGEKTRTNQQCERLAKIRQTTGNIWSWRQGIARLVRWMPFATSPVLKQHWLPNRRLSTRTVRNVWNQRDFNQGVIKRLLLVDRHRRSRLAWCLARRGRNLRTWCKIHWSDESRFLLHVTDDRMRVWRHKNTAYTSRNIQPTLPYGGGSVMVWGVSLMTTSWI